MKKINKAVLPVAGFGTRFLPATKAIPKEMLSIIDNIFDTEEVNACIYKGEKFDCGSKKGFVEATIAISLRDHEIGEEIKNVIKNI